MRHARKKPSATRRMAISSLYGLRMAWETLVFLVSGRRHRAPKLGGSSTPAKPVPPPPPPPCPSLGQSALP
uniref:Uncharacterized protein n=1 Tax=Arundo donax TaxID=35708 RepID=A0A0A8XYT0_ARUDO